MQESKRRLWVFLNISLFRTSSKKFRDSKVPSQDLCMFGVCTYIYHTFKPDVMVNIPVPWSIWDRKPSSQTHPNAICEIPILFYHCAIHCMRFYSPSKCSLASQGMIKKMGGQVGSQTPLKISGRKSLGILYDSTQINQNF